MVGFFPVIAFQALQRAAAATLRVFVPQMTRLSSQPARRAQRLV